MVVRILLAHARNVPGALEVMPPHDVAVFQPRLASRVQAPIGCGSQGGGGGCAGYEAGVGGELNGFWVGT